MKPLSLSRDLLEELKQHPLVLAIIGHTNTGKTSIVRTLSHDARFGKVSDEPGITLNCDAKSIQLNGFTLAYYFDTPGFERASTIAMQCGPDADPRAILQYLKTPAAEDGEWKKLHRATVEQLQVSDIFLYVIDVSDEPKSEHETEIQLIKGFAKPFLVLSNFESAESVYRDAWQQRLKKVWGGLLLTPFDAHRRSASDEDLLYLRLSANAERQAHRALLDFWIKYKQQDRNRATDRAATAIASLLVDVAATRPSQGGLAPAEATRVKHELVDGFQSEVQSREHATIKQIIDAFGFGEDAVENTLFRADSECRVATSLWNRKNLLIAGGGAGMIIGIFLGAFVGWTMVGIVAGAAIGVACGYLHGVSHPQRIDETQIVSGQATMTLLGNLFARMAWLAEALRVRGHGKESKKGQQEVIPAFPADFTKHLTPVTKQALDQSLKRLLQTTTGVPDVIEKLEVPVAMHKPRKLQALQNELQALLVKALQEVADCTDTEFKKGRYKSVPQQ